MARKFLDSWRRRNNKAKLVYVVDGRTPTPSGAVDPEDIIGAFQVSGGAIVAASYQRNKNHAILSKNGFMRLDASLQQHLLADLAARA